MERLDTGAQSADLAEVDKGKEVHREAQAVPRDQEKEGRQEAEKERERKVPTLWRINGRSLWR